VRPVPLTLKGLAALVLIVFPRRTGWRRGSRWSSAGYEGYVAKDEALAYMAGRTRSWLKVKVRDVEDRWRRVLMTRDGG
jgi:hypothetical protein